MTTTEPKSLADRLGDFLIALASTDRVKLGAAGEALRQAMPMPIPGERRPPLGALTTMAEMQRFYELNEIPGSPDAHAFGAARLALEMRLEQILEEMMRASGTVAVEVSHG